MKRLLPFVCASALVLTLAPPALAEDAPPAPAEKPAAKPQREGKPEGRPEGKRRPLAEMAEKLKAADADGDGKITKAEFDAAFSKAPPERSAALFKSLDADGDGTITKEEVEAHMAKKREEFAKGGEGRPGKREGKPEAKPEGAPAPKPEGEQK